MGDGKSASPGGVRLWETCPLKMYVFMNMEKYTDMEINTYTFPGPEEKTWTCLESCHLCRYCYSLFVFSPQISVPSFTLLSPQHNSSSFCVV